MTNKKDYFKKQLDILFENCFQGLLHIRAWEDLNNVLGDHKNVYERYNLFWLSSLKAQLDVSQLHLIKLFDNHSGSLKMDSLIKYADDNKDDLFDGGDFQFIEIEVANYKKEISSFNDLINTLIKIRNKHFVHLSKEYAPSYDELYKDYTTVRTQFKEILIICAELLGLFYQLAFNESKLPITGKEFQTKKLIGDLAHYLKLIDNDS